MSGIGFPSLNQVSVIGRIAQEPVFGNSGRVRTVTLGVETEDEGGSRVHRITIQDEFLVRAMHDRLVIGAMVHVLGELDYDDNGCFVAVTQRRGSDVHVLGAADSEAVQRPAPVVARAAPAVPAQAPRPVPASVTPRPVAVVAPPAEPATPEPVAPVEPDPEIDHAQEAQAPNPPVAPVAPPALAPRRPFPATPPSFPAHRPTPPKPPAPIAAATGGGVLSGLRSTAPVAEEPPFPGDVPSKPNGGLGGLRPPPLPGGVRKPTGPDSFDDDIPF